MSEQINRNSSICQGIVYGVGVGPGDPELMTLKAVRIIREADIIAVPGKKAEDSLAYRIAAGAVPEISGKTVIGLEMPMTKDAKALAEAHEKGARVLEEYLKTGKTAAFLTLGDPTVYSTFAYLVPFLETDGFTVKYISGVTSFCAAAAKLNVPLCTEGEKLAVIPGLYDTDTDFSLPGTCVLMKSGRQIKELREKLKGCGKDIMAVQNCGLEGEQTYCGLEEIPENAGYFLVVLAREKGKD